MPKKAPAQMLRDARVEEEPTQVLRFGECWKALLKGVPGQRDCKSRRSIGVLGSFNTVKFDLTLLQPVAIIRLRRALNLIA